MDCLVTSHLISLVLMEKPLKDLKGDNNVTIVSEPEVVEGMVNE